MSGKICIRGKINSAVAFFRIRRLVEEGDQKCLCQAFAAKGGDGPFARGDINVFGSTKVSSAHIKW